MRNSSRAYYSLVGIWLIGVGGLAVHSVPADAVLRAEDVIAYVLGVFVLLYGFAAVRTLWRVRRLSVWDCQERRWRAAGRVMRDRAHR